MTNKKLDRNYVSDIEKFMRDFDSKHALSLSQQEEVLKYERIFHLRDDPNAEHPAETIWGD